jgi:Tat protein translocase TatB subunit
MNILGIGPGEMVLIATLGLIVFGPQRLPEMAAKLGKMVADFRRSTQDINQEFREAFAFTDIRQAATEVTQALQETATTVNEVTHGTYGPQDAQASSAALPPPPVEGNGWHFEGAAATAAPEANRSSSFWDWSEVEPVATAKPETVGMWVFDPPPPPAPAEDPLAASAVATVVETAASSADEAAAEAVVESEPHAATNGALAGEAVAGGPTEGSEPRETSPSVEAVDGQVETSESGESAGVELSSSRPARRDG